MSSILDITTANFMSKWNQLPSWKRLEEIEEVVGRKGDILFLVKTNQFAMSEGWEMWQVVSNSEEKVIDFFEKSYDEYEIIIKISINDKVYRI